MGDKTDHKFAINKKNWFLT